MKNKESWFPSKFVRTERKYKASRNTKEVGIGSRFVADIQCSVYERALREHAHGLLLDLGCGRVPLYQIYSKRSILESTKTAPRTILVLGLKVGLALCSPAYTTA